MTKHFTKEEVLLALSRIAEGKEAPTQVARTLGVTPTTIRRWRREAKVKKPIQTTIKTTPTILQMNPTPTPAAHPTNHELSAAEKLLLGEESRQTGGPSSAPPHPQAIEVTASTVVEQTIMIIDKVGAKAAELYLDSKGVIVTETMLQTIAFTKEEKATLFTFGLPAAPELAKIYALLTPRVSCVIFLGMAGLYLLGKINKLVPPDKRKKVATAK